MALPGCELRYSSIWWIQVFSWSIHWCCLATDWCSADCCLCWLISVERLWQSVAIKPAWNWCWIRYTPLLISFYDDDDISIGWIHIHIKVRLILKYLKVDLIGVEYQLKWYLYIQINTLLIRKLIVRLYGSCLVVINRNSLWWLWELPHPNPVGGVL